MHLGVHAEYRLAALPANDAGADGDHEGREQHRRSKDTACAQAHRAVARRVVRADSRSHDPENMLPPHSFVSLKAITARGAGLPPAKVYSPPCGSFQTRVPRPGKWRVRLLRPADRPQTARLSQPVLEPVPSGHGEGRQCSQVAWRVAPVIASRSGLMVPELSP